MAERELIVARARAETSKAGLMATIAELKHRLKPATLASDAWDGVKGKSSEVSGKGVQAVTDHPGAAGGAVAAVALFFLRKPLATLAGKMFGSQRDEGQVTTDLSAKPDNFDLTAPVVTTKEGAHA